MSLHVQAAKNCPSNTGSTHALVRSRNLLKLAIWCNLQTLATSPAKEEGQNGAIEELKTWYDLLERRFARGMR
jgi:hypothetical protein